MTAPTFGHLPVWKCAGMLSLVGCATRSTTCVVPLPISVSVAVPLTPPRGSSRDVAAARLIVTVRVACALATAAGIASAAAKPASANRTRDVLVMYVLSLPVRGIGAAAGVGMIRSTESPGVRRGPRHAAHV